MKKKSNKSKLQNGLSLLFCLFIFLANGQDVKPVTKLYLYSSGGVGSYKNTSADIGLKSVFKDKWSMSLSYKSVEMDPKNMPSDYQAEVGYVLFIPYSYKVTSEMNIVSLTAGKYFKLGKNTWATTEGGISYVQGEKVDFQRTPVVSSNIILIANTSSNYSTTKVNKSSVGAMFQADINWAFASFMGLGADIYANFNSIQSPIGFQFKLLIGKMGKEKKHKS